MEGSLRALLGLSLVDLRHLLHGVPFRELHKQRQYLWRDLEPRLQSFGHRALLRARRCQIATSKMWVAGYARLLQEWHPERNGLLLPDEVSFGAGFARS